MRLVHAHICQDEIREVWIRPERKRQAKALIAGGTCIGWMAGALYLTVSAHAWTFALFAGAIVAGAIAKTLSVYKNF
ncbi:MAG TPA: hypothetical protein VGD60_00210 [Candidatus Acidoferrales bacterium]